MDQIVMSSTHEDDSSRDLRTGSTGRACEACRKKKTKCDMQQPICGLCRRTKHECHFPVSRKRPRRQSPSTRAKLQKVTGNLDRLVELLDAKSHDQSSDPTNPTDIDRYQMPRLNGISRHAVSHSMHDQNVNDDLARSTSNTPSLETSPHPSLRVSRELALHLLDVYFDKLQTWLGLFHKPTFMDWATKVLTSEDDSISGQRPQEALLFYSIFALAARFSDHGSLGSSLPRDRGYPFYKAADHYFRIARDEEPCLEFLQGSVLFAVYCNGAGFSKRAWLVISICVRLCYSIGAHRVDEDDGDTVGDSGTWVQKELMRRAFWSTWELDSFSAIMMRQPCAFAWRHIEVKLPISDDAWFTYRHVSSSKFVFGPECWKCLANGENQDERAWYLLAKAMVAFVNDLTMTKAGISEDQKAIIETNISCFKLALPDSFLLTSTEWSTSRLPPARKNNIIAIHLYITAAAFMNARSNKPDEVKNNHESVALQRAKRYRDRMLVLSEVITKWPPECIPYANPGLVCVLFSYDEALVRLLPQSDITASYRDLSGLVFIKFARYWRLAAKLIEVRDLVSCYYDGDQTTRAELAKQYPIYFDQSMRSQRMRNILTRKTNDGTPSLASLGSNITPQSDVQIRESEKQNYVAGGPSDDVWMQENFFDTTGLPELSSLSSQSPNELDGMLSGMWMDPMWQDFVVPDFMAVPNQGLTLGMEGL